MDLIYTNKDKEDVGILNDYDFDLAIGSDENNFELKIDLDNHCCSNGCLVYIEGTEYGGIIDSMKIATKSSEITYKGRTWHGLLESKVIEPLLATDESGGGVVVHKGGKNLIDSNSNQGFARCTGTYKNGSATLVRNTTENASYFCRDYENLEVGKTYTVSAKCNTTDSRGAYLQAMYYFVDENGTASFESIKTAYGQTELALTITPTKVSKKIRFLFGLRNTTAEVGTEITFTEMQLEVGDTATSYKPYEDMVGKYLMLSGEANNVIKWLINRIGLSDLFTASEEDSGLFITGYKMNRYVNGYTGIRKMLATAGGKLQITFQNGKVVFSALPLVDYSSDEEFDNDQVEMEIEKAYAEVNHLICLGSGQLTERVVLHLYKDAEGNISDTQTFTGMDEVTSVLDYPNCESAHELELQGIEELKESTSGDSVKMSFDAEGNTYDIGDIVGAREINTGIVVAESITKKIVTINKGKISIQYKVGE